jgi:hypothetical protein
MKWLFRASRYQTSGRVFTEGGRPAAKELGRALGADPPRPGDSRLSATAVARETPT